MVTRSVACWAKLFDDIPALIHSKRGVHKQNLCCLPTGLLLQRHGSTNNPQSGRGFGIAYEIVQRCRRARSWPAEAYAAVLSNIAFVQLHSSRRMTGPSKRRVGRWQDHWRMECRMVEMGPANFHEQQPDVGYYRRLCGSRPAKWVGLFRRWRPWD